MSVDNKNTFSPNQTSPSEPVPPVGNAARQHLRAAMARHEEGDIKGALAEARAALELAPQFAGARSYFGSTLITKQGRYAEGLAELERARETAMDDPALHYTLGWCYEFVAHRITRRLRRSAKGASACNNAQQRRLDRLQKAVNEYARMKPRPEQSRRVPSRERTIKSIQAKQTRSASRSSETIRPCERETPS